MGSESPRVVSEAPRVVSEAPRAGQKPPGRAQKPPGWGAAEEAGIAEAPGAGCTYRDEVGPCEVADDAGRGADAHVADDGEEPPVRKGTCQQPLSLPTPQGHTAGTGRSGSHGLEWTQKTGTTAREQPRLHWQEGWKRTPHSKGPCTHPGQGRATQPS